MSPEESYQKTAETLVEHIKSLIPRYPEILTMSSAWDLFKVPGFKVDDGPNAPSYAQAVWALRKAQKDSQ
jgi:hypothetical protein